MPVETDETSYTVLASNIDDVKPNPNIIVLKNELGEMRKHSRPCVIRFHEVSKLNSPEDHYLRFLQLYMPWRNENVLTQDNRGYKERYKQVEVGIWCDMKKHEPYLAVDYEDLQNFYFIQSDDEEDNTAFSLINPNLLDLDLEDSDSASNAPYMSTIIDNLSLPNEQFHKICSQLREGQQHLFNIFNAVCITLQISTKE